MTKTMVADQYKLLIGVASGRTWFLTRSVRRAVMDLLLFTQNLAIKALDVSLDSHDLRDAQVPLCEGDYVFMDGLWYQPDPASPTSLTLCEPDDQMVARDGELYTLRQEVEKQDGVIATQQAEIARLRGQLNTHGKAHDE